MDTSGMEYVIQQMGNTVMQVANTTQQLTQQLQDQLERTNETQMLQIEALQGLTTLTAQQKYDRLFTQIPVFDGSDKSKFNDWLELVEDFCEMSGRDVREECIASSGPSVRKTIRSLPIDQKWSVSRRELKRCYSYEMSRAHAAGELNKLKPVSYTHLTLPTKRIV